MIVPVTVFSQVRLNGSQCEIDDRSFDINPGCWAFYVPALELKLLHAVGGRVHCTHSSTPDRDDLFEGRAVTVAPTYIRSDWEQALSKSTLTRAAELFIVSRRLHLAGLGPEPMGLAIVRRFITDYDAASGLTAGIHVRNLRAYPPKPDTTIEEILAAGVTPDRILSCVRQQMNGYVMDLNSVVGVMPVDAEDEIATLANRAAEAADIATR